MKVIFSQLCRKGKPIFQCRSIRLLNPGSLFCDAAISEPTLRGTLIHVLSSLEPLLILAESTRVAWQSDCKIKPSSSPEVLILVLSSVIYRRVGSHYLIYGLKFLHLKNKGNNIRLRYICHICEINLYT